VNKCKPLLANEMSKEPFVTVTFQLNFLNYLTLQWHLF